MPLYQANDQLLVGYGTQTAPSYSFVDNPDTGLYAFNSAGDMIPAIVDDGTVVATFSKDIFSVLVSIARISRISLTNSGTLADLAVNFFADSNTGFYRVSSDVLGLVAGGASNVNVGLTSVVVNEAGGDVDFRIEGDTQASLFAVDAGTNRVSMTNSALTGGLLTLTGTVTTISAGSDTVDAPLVIAATVSGNTATNHLIARAIRAVWTNDLTGGGDVQNARLLNFLTSTASGSQTDALASIYLENGVANGTVTVGVGLHIASLQGTTKYGVLDQSGANWWLQSGGLQVGSPTGGFKGAGTINAVGVYDDNVLLNDDVFDVYFDGAPASVDVEEREVEEQEVKSLPLFKNNVRVLDEDGNPMSHVVVRNRKVTRKFWRGSDTAISEKELARYLAGPKSRMSIPDLKDHLRQKRHLPTIPGREQWKKNGKPTVGELTSSLYETIEHQSLYIIELNERLEKLEALLGTLNNPTRPGNRG